MSKTESPSNKAGPQKLQGKAKPASRQATGTGDRQPAGQPREYKIAANGIELNVEERGNPRGEPLILVMGLACQMTVWPEVFLDLLAESGFRVIRFDNRDIGLSTSLKSTIRTPLPMAYARYKVGLPVPADYSLYDMAADVEGLLDALALPQVHLVGVSMGGMIGQILSAQAPERVRSLTLMMTSNNSPRLPLPDVRVLWRINGGGVRGHDLGAARKRALGFWRTVQSPLYPMPEDYILRRVHDDYHRSYRPSGIIRQMRAILATGSLARLSHHILAPTQIIHGSADPLIRVDAAHQLHKHIPHSRLEVIHGMGHDLPAALLPRIAELIIGNSHRAEVSAA